MIKDEQMVAFLEENEYYEMDKMVSLLCDIANGIYTEKDFKKDVKEFIEHDG